MVNYRYRTPLPALGTPKNVRYRTFLFFLCEVPLSITALGTGSKSVGTVPLYSLCHIPCLVPAPNTGPNLLVRTFTFFCVIDRIPYLCGFFVSLGVLRIRSTTSDTDSLQWYRTVSFMPCTTSRTRARYRSKSVGTVPLYFLRQIPHPVPVIYITGTIRKLRC